MFDLKSLNPVKGYPKRTGGFPSWAVRIAKERYANCPRHMIVFVFSYDDTSRVAVMIFVRFSWILSSGEQR